MLTHVNNSYNDEYAYALSWCLASFMSNSHASRLPGLFYRFLFILVQNCGVRFSLVKRVSNKLRSLVIYYTSILKVALINYNGNNDDGEKSRPKPPNPAGSSGGHYE